VPQRPVIDKDSNAPAFQIARQFIHKWIVDVVVADEDAAHATPPVAVVIILNARTGCNIVCEWRYNRHHHLIKRKGYPVIPPGESLTKRYPTKIPPLLEMLKPLARYRQLRPGEYLFRQGDEGSHLYGVISGRLYITVGVANTPDEAVIAILPPGQVVGELSMIDGGTRSANARAEGDVVVGAVSREDFHAHVMRHPEVALRLLTYVSRRLRSATQHVEALALWDVPARLAQTLLNLVEQEGQPHAEGYILASQMSQKTLASIIGSTREWVNAILRDWQAQDIITYDGRRLVVRNTEFLSELVKNIEMEV
jgi:CRP-like cAMP-binding protein